MAFHKREPSKEITTNASHATPLPTYYSQQLPRWTSRSAFKSRGPFDIKTEQIDPCRPQFAAPTPIQMPRLNDLPLLPLSQSRRRPSQSVISYWIFAAVFFLLTFWLASIALGVRLFVALQPAASNPPVQEIRITVNVDALRGSASAYTSFITLSVSVATPMAVANASPAIRDGSTISTPTSHVDAAPTPVRDPLEVSNKSTTVALMPSKINTSLTGFITATRVV